MTYDLTASIVAYNNDPVELERAIRSFLNTELRVTLHVIDNSPTDCLRSICTDPRVQYLSTGKNLGFGAGHNLALHRCLGNANYHLVMNPDIYFGAGTLESLSGYMDLHSDVGVVMPTILYPDGTFQHLCKKLPTPFDLIGRRFLPRSLTPFLDKRRASYEFRNMNIDAELDVPCLSGCFMFIRSQTLDEVGGFDERFFMYMEDVDLFRRIGGLRRVVYCPVTKVFHGYAKGSYSSVKLMLHHVNSAVKYFSKWGWFPLY